MALFIELPSEVEEELTLQAAQRGISASELVSFLLQHIRRSDLATPTQSAVETDLRQNALDADRSAELAAGQMASHLGTDGPYLMTSDRTIPLTLDPLDRDRLISILRGSKGPEINDSVDRGEHKTRVSALGKFAHIGLSTDALIAEKRLDTAREDRL